MSAGFLGGILPAHGLGGRSDLPVAPWLATYAGGAVIVFSFYALAALWAVPRLRGSEAGLALPWLERIADARVTRAALRILGMVLLVAFLTVAWFGPHDMGRTNPAPTWFYVWFWVGLVPCSLLLGPIWRLLNPLRALASALAALLPTRQLSLPEAVGYLPAAAGLTLFLWIELVYDHAASSRTVAAFVTAYVLNHTIAGALFGPRWFERCDGFEVYSAMIARSSPIGRRADGRVVLRNPLDGLAGTPERPDLTPVVVVVLGSTVFDGLSRTSWWADRIAGTSRGEYLVTGTLGLIAGIAVVAMTYGCALWLTRNLGSRQEFRSAHFAHSLIPIAIGYTVAHYFSFAVFQGQQGILLANDPLGRGWNLLGEPDANVNYTLISGVQIAFIQIGAIVLGHVLAVIASHDRAVSLFRPVEAVRRQYPLMLVMVAYTCGGIVLLAGA